jgi:mannosyltransferase
VLLVTGAYYPEISASGVQCRAVAAALGARARVSVLTTSVSAVLPAIETIDGVVVYRVHVDVRSRASKAMASVGLVRRLLQAKRTYDIIHVHGFSQKNVPVSLLARLLGKPVVLTLHTAGQDEPDVVRRNGPLAYWAFRSADLVLSVSPHLLAQWRAANLPSGHLRLAPNGIDTTRFRPADANERRVLRESLGWPEAPPVIVFVGFFSRDKRPDVLFNAWRRLGEGGVRTRLAFIGATRTGYYEIDESIADAMRREAAALGKADDVMWIEPTNDVDRYFRAADVFVLPSVREAHPLALLEAMACGLPSIATRLPATEALVDDRVNGRLFAPDDAVALADALREVLSDEPAARQLGARARETVTARYDVRRTADDWLSAYDEVRRP